MVVSIPKYLAIKSSPQHDDSPDRLLQSLIFICFKKEAQGITYMQLREKNVISDRICVILYSSKYSYKVQQKKEKEKDGRRFKSIFYPIKRKTKTRHIEIWYHLCYRFHFKNKTTENACNTYQILLDD